MPRTTVGSTATNVNIPAFFLLQMISTVFIGMNIVTLPLLVKAFVSMHAKLRFNFFSVLFFWSCFLDNPFIQSKQFYSSDLFYKGLILVSFKICFFIVNECNCWLSFSIPLMNINEWVFFYSLIISWRRYLRLEG